ncbi:MAG: type III secretion system translocon subunit SctE [Kiritimatiellae bacterium]|nr:type III secretion system translocon subunit SctE [Kiritimatiellia bacterium]
MSDTIPNVNTGAPQRPSYVDQADTAAKGAGISQKATQIAKEVAALLGGRGVTVSTSVSASSAQETGTPTGATGIPSLDNPDSVKQLNANLEKLIAYLQLDNDERQAQMAKDRIEINQNDLEKQHKERIDKINESLEKMDKASKMGILGKIFGWAMAALAVVAAVAACVATGGVALGPCVGALVAVGSMVLSETGTMDKIVKGLSDLLQKAGMSKQAAQIVAQVAICAAIIAASVGAGYLGSASKLSGLFTTSATLQNIAQNASPVLRTVMVGMGILGIGMGGYTAKINYDSGNAQADVSEAEKFLEIMRQRLAESEEELNQILQSLQNGISDVAELIASHTDTAASIARNIGQMA